MVKTNKMADIPIVDFGKLGESCCISNQSSDVVDQISKDIYEAFSTTGFLYIKNHGIKQEKILNLFSVTNTFFQQPNEVKSLSARPKNGTNQGWVGYEVENLNPNAPGDLKEAFNIQDLYNDSLPWPTTNCDEFKETVRDFFQSCKKLALCILDFLSLGLELKDKGFLRRQHKDICGSTNATALRILYYPASNGELKTGQLRCGEHSDYGSITLLFQDDVGGLEVCKRNGEFAIAEPIEGTVLVNIGDLMQRWTNNKLISTRHRVVMPKNPSLCSKVRRSAAFFVHPNDDTVVECLDGSRSYPPITALDYLNQRFSATYI